MVVASEQVEPLLERKKCSSDYRDSEPSGIVSFPSALTAHVMCGRDIDDWLLSYNQRVERKNPRRSQGCQRMHLHADASARSAPF